MVLIANDYTCRGEDRPRRRKSNWNRYVAFSQESADTPGV
jgi:hypothetical protein